MKRTSFVSAALLSLSACGSGNDFISPLATPSAYVYVASAGDSPTTAGRIYEYAVYGDSTVSRLPEAPIAAGVYPAAVLINQGNVYVVNVGDGTISQYRIAADNTLMPMSPATVANPGMHTFGAAPASAVIDASGSYLYVVNTADSTLSQFSISESGQLTPLTPSTVATGVTPIGIASVQVSGTPIQYYYVLNSGAAGDTGGIAVFATSGVSGALALLDSYTLPTGMNASAIAVDNISSTVDVLGSCDTAQCNGSIKQFIIGANAALTDAGSTVSTGSVAVNMIFDDDGANDAFVISNGVGADANAGTLWQYETQSAGELTPVDPPTVGIGSAVIAQRIDIGTLLVLTSNAGVNNTNTGSTGGNIYFYGFGTSSLATLVSSAKIDAPYPIAMGVQVLLPP